MHTMTLINEHEGTEEWLCSTCGRHMLVSWNPVFKKTILVEGASSVKHTGSKKSLFPKDKRDMPKALLVDSKYDPIQNARLEPWIAWMDEVNFENLWDEDTH